MEAINRRTNPPTRKRAPMVLCLSDLVAKGRSPPTVDTSPIHMIWDWPTAILGPRREQASPGCRKGRTMARGTGRRQFSHNLAFPRLRTNGQPVR
jgi:hypothetical protein